jgi:hypothetical protein
MHNSSSGQLLLLMSFVQLFDNPWSLKAAYKVVAAQSPRYASPTLLQAQAMLIQTRKESTVTLL